MFVDSGSGVQSVLRPDTQGGDLRWIEYYQPPSASRRYQDIPRHSTWAMDESSILQSHANTIEAAICLWDESTDHGLKDESAIDVLEMLLDQHHFQDVPAEKGNEGTKQGFDRVSQAIREDLGKVPPETVVKIIGAIRLVAKRRSRGSREYLNFIRQHVGVRAGPGMRILPSNFSGE